MNRDQLVAALDGDGEAAALCRRALLDGAELVMLPGAVATAELRTIYRRRAEHLRQHGAPAVDADDAADAADRLDQTAHTDLVVGRVDGGLGRHVFQLFFDAAAEHVVACLAIPDQQRTNEST